VILRRLHLVLFLLLATVAVVPTVAHALAGASVSGVVRNSAGVPQMGAQVQLLRPDMTVIATAMTDSNGAFSFQSLFPGKYAIKAIGASFLPSLRENVRVRTATVVSLTLNTLYEVMQWLPSQPRNVATPKDDWAWTLRSAANRPLLRWLEDGPLVVVSDGPNTRPKLKARLVASGRQGSFGENGERISMEVEETPSQSRELLARVDFDPSSDAGMESTLGFRQDMGFAGSVESVAAVAVHPEMETAGAAGLEEAAVKTSEHMDFGDLAEAEVGAEQVLARFSTNTSGNQAGTNTIFAALPYADVSWHKGDSAIRYRMATAVPAIGAGESGSGNGAADLLPAVSMRNGSLVLEHGLHQEIGWERQTDATGLQVLVFADSLSNPVLEASERPAQGSVATAGALLDNESGLLRTAGQGFSTTGVMATLEKRLPGGNSVRLSYANGDALVIPVAMRGPLSLLAAQARPKRVQMYSLSLSGTIEGTGTRWRASYRWQPEETLTRVAPFALDAAEPFLNLHVRQPMCRTHGEHTRSIDALMDVRNLLAQGYRPFVLPDGSVLVFAQDQRSLSAGLAFTF
jgi:hypothetical protein